MDSDGVARHEPGAETVYGTHDDNAMVMSEKVIVLSQGSCSCVYGPFVCTRSQIIDFISVDCR